MLSSSGQSAEWAHVVISRFRFVRCRANANFGTFAEGFEEDQVHAINTAIDLELGALRFCQNGDRDWLRIGPSQ